jgi:hypothetical protein
LYEQHDQQVGNQQLPHVSHEDNLRDPDEDAGWWDEDADGQRYVQSQHSYWVLVPMMRLLHPLPLAAGANLCTCSNLEPAVPTLRVYIRNTLAY